MLPLFSLHITLRSLRHYDIATIDYAAFRLFLDAECRFDAFFASLPPLLPCHYAFMPCGVAEFLFADDIAAIFLLLPFTLIDVSCCFFTTRRFSPGFIAYATMFSKITPLIYLATPSFS